MLQILTECSALVHNSLKGLDYFIAEGAQAFDDLASIMEDISSFRVDGGAWANHIKESLKAGKLYLTFFRAEIRIIKLSLKYLKTRVPSSSSKV